MDRERGCPCSQDCCEEPTPYHPEHYCGDSDREDDEFCEECYVTECRNCGRQCYCEL